MFRLIAIKNSFVESTLYGMASALSVIQLEFQVTESLICHVSYQTKKEARADK